jgi:hypothetical protein
MVMLPRSQNIDVEHSPNVRVHLCDRHIDMHITWMVAEAASRNKYKHIVICSVTKGIQYLRSFMKDPRKCNLVVVDAVSKLKWVTTTIPEESE